MIDPASFIPPDESSIPDSYVPGGPVQDVSPVLFEPLGGSGADTGASNLEFLGDVSIQVCVELGRASLTVSEVLGLKVGSVVELEKLAGEPGDVYINGTMVGRGEIVVVDDRFGIRVFDVVDPR
ncbi:MAG: flagellar motor switch protein FliN, partial [Chloroflexota bacterium]